MLRGNAATLDASSLPSGRVDLRLLVSDGFYTTRAKSISVTIPTQPPSVSIMSPRPGGTLIAGDTMRLWGAVTVTGSNVAEEDVKAIWYIDDKQVAEGLDVFTITPGASKHRARLGVTVARQRAVASVEFQSVRVPPIEELESGKG